MAKKYSGTMPERMYRYFVGYSEPVGAPSFTKFAALCGVTPSELASFRKNAKFDAMWRECNEIRRDYLIDNALSRRLDASFAKFLLSLEFPEECADGSELRVTLEVLGDGNEA